LARRRRRQWRNFAHSLSSFSSLFPVKYGAIGEKGCCDSDANDDKRAAAAAATKRRSRVFPSALRFSLAYSYPARENLVL